MANFLTRTPEGIPPALPGFLGPVVSLADWFMVVALSRPPSGTLRTTWVTPATLGLCGLLVMVGLPMGIAALGVAIATGPVWLVLVAAALLVLGGGSLTLLVVGVAQRLARAG